ncbi:MAG: hypothetical protein ACLTSX_02595 [Collinsella sp.]
MNAASRNTASPFGISCCWTRENADAVATEANMDWMIEKGALFCWYFHYMPVGACLARSSLMPTPEQRERMYHFVRDMRSKKELFTHGLPKRWRVRGEAASPAVAATRTSTRRG